MFRQGWLVNLYPQGGGLLEDIEITGNSNLLEILRLLNMFDNCWTTFSMAGMLYQKSWYCWRTMCFFCPKGWEKATFLKTGWNFNFKSVDTLMESGR